MAAKCTKPSLFESQFFEWRAGDRCDKQADVEAGMQGWWCEDMGSDLRKLKGVDVQTDSMSLIDLRADDTVKVALMRLLTKSRMHHPNAQLSRAIGRIRSADKTVAEWTQRLQKCPMTSKLVHGSMEVILDCTVWHTGTM